MNTKINQNLFRFVTLRNPQLISDKDTNPGFVQMSDTVKQLLSDQIYGQEVASRLSLEAACEGDGDFQTKDDLKSVNEPLYRFSNWLMRNKNHLTYTAIKENIIDVDPLIAPESGENATEKRLAEGQNYEMVIWKNLVHQTVACKSTYVREGLIQLLVANAFVKAFYEFANGLSEDITFTEDQEQQFKRRACASVIIDKLFLQKKKTPTADLKLQSMSPELTKAVEDKAKVINAKYTIKSLETLKSELKDIEVTYNKTTQKEYDEALQDYNKTVETILDNVKAPQPSEPTEENPSIPTEPTIPGDISEPLLQQAKTNIADSTIKDDNSIYNPAVKLPKFEFNAKQPITKWYLKSRLTSNAYNTFLAHKLDMFDTFNEVYTTINSKIKSQQNIVSNNSNSVAQRVAIGGSTLTVLDPLTNLINTSQNRYQLTDEAIIDDYLEPDFPEDIPDFPNPNNPEVPTNPVPDPNQDIIYPTQVYDVTGYTSTSNLKLRIPMLVKVDGTETQITSIECRLQNNLIPQITYNYSTENVLAKNTNATIRTSIFPQGITPTPGSYKLWGKIELSDGKIIAFNVDNFTYSTTYRTAFKTTTKLVTEVDNGNEDSNQTTIEQTYGVTNLGIADFRRVEQEVCCYVAGEVSHIENIMAREYKERETRSLLRKEDLTESTTESERESLTDSTTTERNELQSEIATILNEDQSQAYGASAGVSGGVGDSFKFNADAYFDASSSSSQSNSNTQAQNYAKEITERAMERIVQKTKTKRTKRIIKEFEENNTHGFDNREGDSHVAGVYRWVDKIYKNKLINYGKRLMYEFAIPEPARFLRDALWKNTDNDRSERKLILPVKPKHPNEYGLIDSEDITTSNYQTLASYYNAEVKPKPKNEISIGKSMAFTAAESNRAEWDEASALAESIIVPEGYETKSAKVDFRVPQEGNLSGSILVGTKKFSFSYYNETKQINFSDIGKFTNEIPVSYSSLGFHSGNIGIEVKCSLTEGAKEQWENETYIAIMQAYQERVNEYNEAVSINQDEIEKQKLKFNPLSNRSLEKKELKRLAIELITKPFGVKTAKNNYDSLEANAAIQRNQEFQKHSQTVKFFEQAFDWDIMAYTFYPYMYADKTQWKDLFQEQDAADPIFQAFLQSGMARTVVPVREGFEDAINWYMQTGEIWNGQSLIADTEDDLYVSVAEEMQTIEGTVEGTWETRVPTNLTLLQAGSVGLNVEGLPCNTDCNDNLVFDSDGNVVIENDKPKNAIDQSQYLIGDKKQGVGTDIVGKTAVK